MKKMTSGGEKAEKKNPTFSYTLNWQDLCLQKKTKKDEFSKKTIM